MNRLLFVSNLFPDSGSPRRGLDNVVLLRTLREQFTIRVIVPRPTLPVNPGKSLVCCEQDRNFEPLFVPVPYVPKCGSPVNAILMRRALRQPLRQLVERFRPEVVMTSWLFPDGCALASLCREQGLPSVLITQGTDTHTYLDSFFRRRQILAAIEISEAVICRSADLARRLAEAGADPKKLHPVYNGVDSAIFRPRPQIEARRVLGLPTDQPILLFVGNFLSVKNPLFLIRAHAALVELRPQAPVTLLLIGSGPLETGMRREAVRLGTANLVVFAGACTSPEVGRHMNAADALCLTSHNEGLANVVLEALASRLRVVSTDVGGIGEVIDRKQRGQLVASGDLVAYTAALADVLDDSANSREDHRGGGIDAEIDDFSWRSAGHRYASIIRDAAQAFSGHKG